ncbi:MAG: winged helix-turn-helix domain-containing protein, partial [Acidobacteria bacterium]|nr:winged helix-turn-helix domain-containing protein [Acidobacteriota bacterium]
MRSFQLGPWAVHPERHELSREGEQRRVGSKVMEVLCCLASEPGRVVAKDELVERCWDGDFTSDEALSAVIYELRRTLDDDARSPRFVETIRKRGYRLVAPVAELPSGPPRQGEGEDPGSSPDLSASEAAEAAPAPLLEHPSGSSPRPPATTSPARVSRRWLTVAVGAAAAIALALFFSSLREPREATPQASAAAPEIRSLAVLPVSTFSAEGSELALAGALTDMLTSDLAQACPLEVAPGISVRQEGTWDLDRVASELGVDAIIEASVLRSGDRYWISVQLVETGSGRLLWGASYDRQGPEALTVLREVALDVALQVTRALPPSE